MECTEIVVLRQIDGCSVKGAKGAVSQWGLGEVLISQTLAVEPVGG